MVTTKHANAYRVLSIIFIVCLLMSKNVYATNIEIIAGFQSNDLRQLREEEDELPIPPETTGSGYHLGVNIMRPIFADPFDNSRHSIGVGIDVMDLQGSTLVGYRAINYYYQLTRWIRVGAFFGAASLDNKLPQNGYYSGVNLNITNIFENLDVVAGINHGNGLARDKNLVPEENLPGRRPDFFINFYSTFIGLQYRF